MPFVQVHTDDGPVKIPVQYVPHPAYPGKLVMMGLFTDDDFRKGFDLPEMESESPLAEKMYLTEDRTSPRRGKIMGLSLNEGYLCTAQEMIAGFWRHKYSRTSMHYCIGKDGEILQSVPEGDRSWTGTSHGRQTPKGWNGVEYDHNSVSICFASDTLDNCDVTDATFESLIKLSADILKRNGIDKLLWADDPMSVGQWDKQNVALHRWFVQHEPTTGIFSTWLTQDGHMETYAREVNKLLGH